jgi:hypothetical protein
MHKPELIENDRATRAQGPPTPENRLQGLTPRTPGLVPENPGLDPEYPTGTRAATQRSEVAS